MAIFPLRSRPKESYKEHPRSFGSPRSNGARKHAGCDLYAPAGAEILAVEDGTVLRGPYLFYDGVLALDVQHSSGIVRPIPSDSCSINIENRFPRRASAKVQPARS